MAWAPDDIIGMVAVIGILVIPGIGLTARFALKPMVESMLRIRDSLDRERRPPEDGRLSALEERVAGMESLLERMAETVEFDAHLRAGRARGAVPPGTPPPGPRLVRPGGEPPAQAAGPGPHPALDRSVYEEEYS